MISKPHNQRPSEWRKLFGVAVELLDQVKVQLGGYEFQWSFGGGTAMMLQIEHRESHDIDLFFDDAQMLGFLDPAKTDLILSVMPSEYGGDGARFQKFAFADLGEIDFIAAGPLSSNPFTDQEIEGRVTKLETVAEIITKKIYHRGGEAKARDIFDIAAGSLTYRAEIVAALAKYPVHTKNTLDRLRSLNPEFVASTIDQLMIMPAYRPLVPECSSIVERLLEEVVAVAGLE
ncbi:nucleotidyl transferase AbiEii/AbiGii toxin family protein [Devosia sp. A369]